MSLQLKTIMLFTFLSIFYYGKATFCSRNLARRNKGGHILANAIHIGKFMHEMIVKKITLFMRNVYLE